MFEIHIFFSSLIIVIVIVIRVWKFVYSGNNGIWGKSLILQNPDNGFRICATITASDDNIDHLAEARFQAPIAGPIYFRWLSAKDTNHRDTLITTDLHHVRNITTAHRFTTHRWKIFVTDIFENNPEKSQINCNVLQLIYDPQNAGTGKSIGDIDGRVGEIKIAGFNQLTGETKNLYQDDELILLPSDLSGPHRHLFVVIFDHIHTNQFLSCAKIRNMRSRVAK